MAWWHLPLHLPLLANKNPREQEFHIWAKHFPTQISHLVQVLMHFHARDFCMSGAPCIAIDGALCIIIDSGQCTFVGKVNNVEKQEVWLKYI